MITVIAGTNRPGSNTLKIAKIVQKIIEDGGEQVRFLDLALLPPDLMAPSSYEEKPAAFTPFQEAILQTDGILSVVPEYNGSFPGIFKYFIDMLRFPDSLYEKPAAFVGISAGRWGSVRAVEHLEMVFQYRHAHLFGRRVFIPAVGKVIGGDGLLSDPELGRRLEEMVAGFAGFCDRLCDEPDS